ncbi:hypothetical protein JCM9279_004650 [Rhodotorula babjevae]
MSASTGPQAPTVGPQFPDWDAKTFLEIKFRSLGFAQGFSVAWDDTAPKGVHSFYCAETPTVEGFDSCPCAWTVACDAKTGTFHTTSADFKHAHPQQPTDSEERREIVQEQRAFLVEAVDDLEETATARFDQPRKLSSYRIGFESMPGPSHSVQQQVIVWDLAVGVGQARARGFELKMRLEDRLVDDYPTTSTLDAPHPLQAALEPLPVPAAVTAAVASTSSHSTGTSTPSAMPALVDALPFAPSRTVPVERPPPPRPRARSATSSSSRPSPLVFSDWWQFEHVVEALATSESFQVGLCEVKVDEDVLALGCTEPGCTWRVAVAPTSNAEYVVVAEKTRYEHKHAPPVRKRKASEKPSFGGASRGKGLVKADKAQKKKKGVTFKEPSPSLSPPPVSSTPRKRTQARRKVTRSPVIEYDVPESEDDDNYVFAGKVEPDELIHTEPSSLRPSTVMPASPAPNPTSCPLLVDSSVAHPPNSPIRLPHPPIGTAYAPAAFYSSPAASASSAATFQPSLSLALGGGLSGLSDEQHGEATGAAARGPQQLDVKGASDGEEESAGGGPCAPGGA